MEDKQIPFFVHEADMTRMERSNHRLWILCIVLSLMLIITNVCWIVYESQWETYEETTQEVTQSAEAEDGSARNIFIGGDNGESETDDPDNN